MTTTKTDPTFPYGTFPVDPLFRACYERDYSRASSYPLPDRLPSHHSLLRDLEGVYSLAYTLPPWWPLCVAQVKLERLKTLLETISASEFRTGCIEQARWKAFRETLSDEERHRVPTSPKIGIMIGETNWLPRFGDRGPTTTPDQLALSISTCPLDFLYMSNGQGWTSCQRAWGGCENYRLPGNFYDTNVALASILAPNTSAKDEEALLARTTLRVFLREGQPVIVIGRIYHNNETVALLLLRQLADLFDRRQLAWGIMIDVNTLSYCQDGSLGADLAERLDQVVLVKSEPSWFPHGWYVPYIDGGESAWDREFAWEGDASFSTQLSASIFLMQPRVQRSTSSVSIPARLICSGMLPPLL